MGAPDGRIEIPPPGAEELDCSCVVPLQLQVSPQEAAPAKTEGYLSKSNTTYRVCSPCRTRMSTEPDFLCSLIIWLKCSALLTG